MEKPTHILGVSAFYHDSAACLLRDGEIIAAAQEERFTRKKHDSEFPYKAIAYCLQEGGITITDVAYIVFYDKPLLKFERLLETYISFAPKGIKSFLTAMPIWMKEKLFLKDLLSKAFSKGWWVGKEGSSSINSLWRTPRIARSRCLFPFSSSRSRYPMHGWSGRMGNNFRLARKRQ